MKSQRGTIDEWLGLLNGGLMMFLPAEYYPNQCFYKLMCWLRREEQDPTASRPLHHGVGKTGVANTCKRNK